MRTWTIARVAAGVALISAALAGVAADVLWAPAAAFGALCVVVLVREPPQGTREWLLMAAVAAVAALAIALVVVATAPG